MRRTILALSLAMVGIAAGAPAAEPVDLARRAAELKNLRWGMFVCWSLSTFSGKEWTPGVKDVAFFRATEADTDQWARTAKEARMGYILFLTKHHDGFCLWDTATTDRKVTKAPLGRDVLAELRKSCDKYGVRLALYFSEGDWTWPGAIDGKGGAGGDNPDVKKAQLKELLTRYGPIEFLWFDHAAGTGGLNHQDTAAWCHACQPGTLIGFNHGEPAGEISLRECGRPGPLGDAASASFNKENEAKHRGYLLAEFTYPILPPHEGGAIWFYSLPKHDNLCLSAEKLYQDYLGAVKHGNIFSVNVGPDYNGRLREIDVRTLRQVGEKIEKGAAEQNIGVSPSEKPSPPAPLPKGEGSDARTAVPMPIKAFCIDFNWGPGGPNGFAPPGRWADADPARHVAWYEGLGANVLQTFAVSCNGYAWYKGGKVPAQPGLKRDFLPEVVRLGRAKGMKVMGYFCVSANTRWGKEHPDLSYGTPSTHHIPLTDEYLDYLASAVEESLQRSGMDGFMIDWGWCPTNDARKAATGGRWLDCEKRLFEQLTQKPFPGEDKLDAADRLAYERRAIDRCWRRIRDAAKRVNPQCILWLSCFDVRAPSVAGSQLFREVDWLMDESGTPEAMQAVAGMFGPHTRQMLCMVGWGDRHDAKKLLAETGAAHYGVYGFTRPGENSLPPPICEYFSRPVDSFQGNDRNIAVLARYFNGKPMDYMERK